MCLLTEHFVRLDFPSICRCVFNQHHKQGLFSSPLAAPSLKLDLLEDSPGPERYDVPQLRCIVAINPDQVEEAGVTVMPQMLLPALI